MTPIKPEEEASDVFAEEGEVQMNGPDGIAASLTPDAAEETSRRLATGASQAREQQARRR
jgi:hypothetical protein